MGLENLSHHESEEGFDRQLRTLLTISRTNSLYKETRCRLDHDITPSSCQIKILSHNDDCDTWPNVRGGNILSAFYAEGLFEEPAITDLAPGSWKHCIHCVSSSTSSTDLIYLCGKEDESKIAKASGHQFSSKLGNIKHLQCIGNLTIEWADNLYEYLESSWKDFPVLKIYWFA
ncbi:hypothetical protein BDZ45DRAFT_754275 [Acephala macrosclerotiorum]|nr:hypothetical protein BDZ45DRAFT_754275 [Acephala macrosclerotiorum]